MAATMSFTALSAKVAFVPASSAVTKRAVSNGTRVLAMAKSSVASEGPQTWLPGVKIPALTEPEWLDRSLPGDFGFDPLGLAKDPAALKWYREAELIHGRLAMLSVIGALVGPAVSGVPWFEAGADPSAVAPFSLGSLLGTQLILTGWVEGKRGVDFFNPGTQGEVWAFPWNDGGKTGANFINATGQQGYPGGGFFDPLGLAGSTVNGVYVVDAEKLERLQKSEIKHARLAMVAFLIFFLQARDGVSPL